MANYIYEFNRYEKCTKLSWFCIWVECRVYSWWLFWFFLAINFAVDCQIDFIISIMNLLYQFFICLFVISHSLETLAKQLLSMASDQLYACDMHHLNTISHLATFARTWKRIYDSSPPHAHRSSPQLFILCLGEKWWPANVCAHSLGIHYAIDNCQHQQWDEVVYVHMANGRSSPN